MSALRMILAPEEHYDCCPPRSEVWYPCKYFAYFLMVIAGLALFSLIARKLTPSGGTCPGMSINGTTDSNCPSDILTTSSTLSIPKRSAISSSSMVTTLSTLQLSPNLNSITSSLGNKIASSALILSPTSSSTFTRHSSVLTLSMSVTPTSFVAHKASLTPHIGLLNHSQGIAVAFGALFFFAASLAITLWARNRLTSKYEQPENVEAEVPPMEQFVAGTEADVALAERNRKRKSWGPTGVQARVVSGMWKATTA